MCTPSSRPGAIFVSSLLWEKGEIDSTSLWAEFDGLEEREWLMERLPSKAYDEAIYAVFDNSIRVDDDQVKNGCSMILDSFLGMSLRSVES